MKDATTRRDFLKAAGLAVTGIAGAAGVSYAQQNDDKKKKDEEKKKDDYDDLFGEKKGDGGEEEEETRACPQCGALMYKQGNTWTCEVCGYSYVE